jgi:hypothetical protein
MESLRTGSNRLDADLTLLQGNLSEVSAATLPHRTFEPEADEEEAPAEHAAAAEAAGAEPVAVNGEGAAVPADAEGAATGAGGDDAEGARLIALNMALNGTPREETERYLSENFELSDRNGLLDEVYASVEG